MDELDSYDHMNYNQFGVSPEDITGLHEAQEGEEFFAPFLGMFFAGFTKFNF